PATSTLPLHDALPIFELGQRTGRHQEFAASMQALETLLTSDARVRHFLYSPLLDVKTRKEALRQAFGGRVHPHFLHFLMIVLDKRRQRLLPEIAQAYRELLDEHLGLLNVRVTLAHEPDERTEEEITTELSRILGRKVVPHIEVDSGILGGIVVRYGDRLMDGSLRRKLLRLRSRMLETSVTV